MNRFSEMLFFLTAAMMGFSVYKGCRYSSHYSKVSGNDGKTRFDVTPSLPVGPFQTVAIVLCFLFCISLGLPMLLANLLLMIPFLLVLCLFLAPFSYNRGRKVLSFTVDPRGILTPSGGFIGKADIAKMFMTAPKVGETYYIHGVGRASTSGVSATLAARSWSFRVIANGRETILAGGLQEPTAASLMHEVGRIIG